MSEKNVSEFRSGKLPGFRFPTAKLVWAGLAVLAALWLGYELYRFVVRPEILFGRNIHPGAIDLEIYRKLVGGWVHGRPIYKEYFTATYPPASYLLLWPVYGWLGSKGTQVLWLAMAAVAMIWMAATLQHFSPARTKDEKRIAFLIPMAIYPTGAVVGNGQTTIFILALVLLTLLTLESHPISWKRDFTATMAFLFALAKPSISAPFFWIILLRAGNLRCALLTISGYVVVTLLSVSFQSEGIGSLFSGWLSKGSALAATGGESNVHRLLADAGFSTWILPASIGILIMLGWWIFRNRRGDLWLLLGVTAIVTRFWCYHRWYDDLLMLFPMLVLARISRSRKDRAGTAAACLGFFTLLLMLAPGGLYLLRQPFNYYYSSFQVVVWLFDAFFLMNIARMENRAVECRRV